MTIAAASALGSDRAAMTIAAANVLVTGHDR